MPYSHDMKDERAPKRLLPQGWRKFKISECVEMTSSKGNPMFKFVLIDSETKWGIDIYAISEPKKRWILKSILSACHIAAGQDGIYNWDIPDVLDKEIMGLVEHEPNNYINRDGNKIEAMQSRITDFNSIEDSNLQDQKTESDEIPWPD